MSKRPTKAEMITSLNKLKRSELYEVIALATHSLEKDWSVEICGLSDVDQDALHTKLHNLIYPECAE